MLRLAGRFISILLLFFLSGAHAATTSSLPDFTQIVERYGSAVVNISTSQKIEQDDSKESLREQIPFPQGTPFDELFRRFFDGREGHRPPASSLGSGFIISPDGYVLTNNHVIQDADKVIVRLSDRRELEAKVIGSDARSDVALLKVDATDLPVVKLGDSKQLKVGEWVLAIGSPFDFDHTVTAGIVSALGRSLPNENYVPFIQTDVAINPGNSGGPLFNLAGEVVGINAQIYSRTGGFMGLSFTIPIDLAMSVVEQIKAEGHVTRGWLGVLIQDVTHELAESFGMERPGGALVSQVLPDSPAEAAGLVVGDVILSFNGQELESSSSLPPMVGRMPVEGRAELRVLRDGVVKKLQVIIGELPSEISVADAGESVPGTYQDKRLGLSLVELTADVRKTLGIDTGGVLVKSLSAGAAAEGGVMVGDVITMIDNIFVDGVGQFKDVVSNLEAGKAVAILVQRRSGPVFLALRIPTDK